MRSCAACAVAVEGSWATCPLCGTPLPEGGSTADPFPTVALRFSRRRVLRVLFGVSLGVIAGSLLVQLLFDRGPAGIGALRSVWLGVVTMWLVVLLAVRKRHNVAKGTVYLVVLVGLLCVYWDYLTGWRAWSLTYAVPIVCAGSALALMITVRLMRVEVGEHIVYTSLMLLLGLTPIAFLALGWETNAVPSSICGALGCTLVLLQLARVPDLRHELAKRLHL